MLHAMISVYFIYIFVILDIDTFGMCLRTSLLLQFMEYLERQLYNAVEGCAVAMSPFPKVLLFNCDFVSRSRLSILSRCRFH